MLVERALCKRHFGVTPRAPSNQSLREKSYQKGKVVVDAVYAFFCSRRRARGRGAQFSLVELEGARNSSLCIEFVRIFATGVIATGIDASTDPSLASVSARSGFLRQPRVRTLSHNRGAELQ